MSLIEDRATRKLAMLVAKKLFILGRIHHSSVPHDVSWTKNIALEAIKSGENDALAHALGELDKATK